MLPFYHLTYKSNTIYKGKCIVYLQMNTMNKTVFAMSVIIATILSVNISVSAVQGHTPTTLKYGEVGQEDQSYFWHDGVLYINAVPTQGNGLFIAETDIDQDYSIDQAIERFGINEDITSFNVQPSEFSDVTVIYELDSDLQFQIVSIQ